MIKIPLVDILQEKKGRFKEVHLILFEFCNMSCSFCHQDHSSKVGVDHHAMFDKVQTLIGVSDPNVPVVVNITGGELFMDDIADEYFDTYYEIGSRIIEHFTEVKLVFGTNLVYGDADRVRCLVERLREKCREVYLATSYDPAGRFTGTQREVFFRNLNQLHDLVDTVNVVLTKQNIHLFLDGKEGPEFKDMCDNFSVYFDHYIPSQMYEYIQPDEDLIGQLYLNINERYPNSYPIRDWKENKFNETTCRSTKIINKDGVVSTCWSEAGKDAILDEAEGLRAKDAAEVAFVEHYECFSCEFYSRCGLRCFLHDTVLGEKSKVCSIKEMFKAIL